MAKKKGKVYRHTIRIEQLAESCMHERAGKKNMSATRYIETLILQDCKNNDV